MSVPILTGHIFIASLVIIYNIYTNSFLIPSVLYILTHGGSAINALNKATYSNSYEFRQYRICKRIAPAYGAPMSPSAEMLYPTLNDE